MLKSWAISFTKNNKAKGIAFAIDFIRINIDGLIHRSVLTWTYEVIKIKHSRVNLVGSKAIYPKSHHIYQGKSQERKTIIDFPIRLTVKNIKNKPNLINLS